MRWRRQLLALHCVSSILIGLTPSFAASLPWETWLDLHRLPEIHRGHQGLLRSSHCLDGCRFDRHSGGDWRYLYIDGEEGVIFEERGAGAITRIWMTMGSGTSVPLEPSIRIRIYIDGAVVPAIDLPISALFDGSTAPFLSPLVGNRSSSSGGNYSYVPIPYRTGCKIALVGAEKERIWFQLNYHRLADAEGVVSFSGTEDLSVFRDLLADAGSDPWLAAGGASVASRITIMPGETRELLVRDGPGSLTALLLRVEPGVREELELVLVFDGERTVQMRLSEFFALGRGGSSPTRSLFIGVHKEGELYSYFPMPFFESVAVLVAHRGSTPAIDIDFEARIEEAVPGPRSGLFAARLSESSATLVGEDFPVLEVHGEGKIVGTFLELGSTSSQSRDYLEGDERFFIDGSLHPAVYGTGVEDYFNGGFYFDTGPFTEALHGAPYTDLDVGGLPTTAAYRIFLTDPITFANRLLGGLEGGSTSNVSMRAKAVTYLYLHEKQGLQLWDRFDIGNPAARLHHGYQVDDPHVFAELDALFEGEPPRRVIGRGVYRPPGAATFVMRFHPTTTRIRLRRRLDALHLGQRATVYVDGIEAGLFPPVYANGDRRWRELDLDLNADVTGDTVTIRVVAEPPPVGNNDGTFTAFLYELWGDGEVSLFADDFESGSISNWSSSAP